MYRVGLKNALHFDKLDRLGKKNISKIQKNLSTTLPSPSAPSLGSAKVIPRDSNISRFIMNLVGMRMMDPNQNQERKTPSTLDILFQKTLIF